MELGEAAYMGFVDDRVLPRNTWLSRAAPGEGRVDDAAFEGERRAVPLVKGQIVACFHFVAEQGRVPSNMTDDLLRIGIEQQLVGIEAVSSSGLVRAVNAIAIECPWPRIGEVAVPDLVGVLRQAEAFDLPLAGAIEQAK